MKQPPIKSITYELRSGMPYPDLPEEQQVVLDAVNERVKAIERVYFCHHFLPYPDGIVAVSELT